MKNRSTNMEETGRKVTDMERCAVTLLSHRNPSDPFLVEWKRSIQTDPHYTVFFEQFEPGPRSAEYATPYRRSTPKELHAILRDGKFPENADPSYAPDEVRTWFLYLYFDEATVFLGNAIVAHRRRGEGDRMTDIHYGESVIAVAISSLASDVVDYVGMIENAWARMSITE